MDALKDEEYCYLTTMGRVTGNPHQIEIWFGSKNNTLYLLSGGRPELAEAAKSGGAR